VYLADHTLTGQRVAIKVLYSHFMAIPAQRQRFINEGRALGQLDHPNIVKLFNQFVENGRLLLVMEFLDGAPLDSILEAETRFDPARAAGVMRSVLSALACAHARTPPLVHRDVKPGNIMLCKDGRVVVTDFGLARQQGDVRLTSAGGLVGTPEYMSPEQIKGADVGPQADIYSAGILLFRMLSGDVPFPLGSDEEFYKVLTAHVGAPVPSLPSYVPTVWNDLLARALAKEPEQRFPSATAFLEALEALDIASRAVDKGTQSRLRRVGAATSRPSISPAPGEAVAAAAMPALQVPPQVQHGAARVTATRRRKAFGVGGVALLIVAAVALAGAGFALVKWTGLGGSGQGAGAASPPAATASSPAWVPPSPASSPVSLPADRAPGVPPTHESAAPAPAPSPPAPAADSAAEEEKRRRQEADKKEKAEKEALMKRAAEIDRQAAEAKMKEEERARAEAAARKVGKVRVPAGTYRWTDSGRDVAKQMGSFCLDRTEVTNMDYDKCVVAGKCDLPELGKCVHLEEVRGAKQKQVGLGDVPYWSTSSHPVICVSLKDAQAYCSYKGGHVPTAPQWEAAARGLEARTFPWGFYGLTGKQANGCDKSCPFSWAETGRDDGYAFTCPVGSMADGAASCGALDMAGNVWEWAIRPDGKPVVKGGAWNSKLDDLRAATEYRNVDSETRWNSIGFRCAYVASDCEG